MKIETAPFMFSHDGFLLILRIHHLAIQFHISTTFHLALAQNTYREGRHLLVLRLAERHIFLAYHHLNR